VKRISDTSVEFYRDFIVPSANTEPGVYRIIKRYSFIPGDYLFELSVTVDGGFSSVPFNFGGAAYTIEFGPQIGPSFAKLTQNYEYRRYYSYANGKRKTEKSNAKGYTSIQERASWAAIAGKYFAFIAIPDATEYAMAFSSEPVSGIPEASRFFMTRPAQIGSKFSNTLRFYLGPKTQKALSVYDNADRNPYKLSKMNMAAVVDSSGILGPLEVAMKWFMLIFYKLIPNYGVSIILLTILVKIIMFPLTKKSSESTIRMQALSPKIKEIQEKYKDNPNKMNAEMAEFYKREGYNPLSGCLPMIIQIPIFFAMYNLFNNHFDLRGAMFIPGWIPDLSLPEYVWDFSPFKLPLLNWSHLRLLPFIYLGSQLLYGKVTQTPDQQGNSQMKMMLYIMPIVFFFMLYDVPAGLLLYWIMSNLLTMVQQVAINKYLAQKKAHIAKEQGAPVIAPQRKKR
jgi:YidC/Oxa1 family membrane protein insertase